MNVQMESSLDVFFEQNKENQTINRIHKYICLMKNYMAFIS